MLRSSEDEDKYYHSDPPLISETKYIIRDKDHNMLPCGLTKIAE